MSETKKDINQIVGDYKYGFKTDVENVFDTGYGINEDVVRKISAMKHEPEWMLNIRLKAYHEFAKMKWPTFGPSLDAVNFDEYIYYIKSSKKTANDWDDVPKEIKETFDKLGIREAEQKYLAGVTTQFESEAVYHNTIKELEDLGVIFCDTDTGLKKHPEIFKEYFTKVVEFKYNRFNQVSLKIDYTENSCLYYKYDQMNRLVEIIDIDKVNSKSYQYDIDGNLEKVTYSNNNSQRIIEYKNQRSSVTIEKAISKKILDFGCDVVLGASPNKGLLGLEEVSNNTFEIINDSYLEVKVTNLAKTDEFMKYDLQTMNIERPDINSLNKTSLSKTYSLWFKPMSTYTTTGFIKLLDENNQEKVKVYLR